MVTARQISTFLGNDGYETKVYLDGESALADFTSYSPDLVLLDYFLPGMNAPEVCISMRKISDTPMIVLSGNTQTSDKIRMLELGADDYIEKPFDPDELKARIHASPNRVFTREQLLDYVWGYDYMGDPRTVDVHIKRLREKIKDHETWSLSTVWGVGYKFEVKA